MEIVGNFYSNLSLNVNYPIYNIKESLKKRRIILHGAKQRAEKNKMSFNLTLEDIQIPLMCPIFNLPLKLNNSERADDSPSIDRIDSSKGYTKDNIIMVSWKVNCIKRNATPEELLKIGQFYKKLHEKRSISM